MFKEKRLINGQKERKKESKASQNECTTLINYTFSSTKEQMSELCI